MAVLHGDGSAASYATLKRGYAGVSGPGAGLGRRGTGGRRCAARDSRRSPRGAGDTEEHSIILMLHSADADFDKVTDARKALGQRWRSIIGLDFPTTCRTA